MAELTEFEIQKQVMGYDKKVKPQTPTETQKVVETAPKVDTKETTDVPQIIKTPLADIPIDTNKQEVKDVFSILKDSGFEVKDETEIIDKLKKLKVLEQNELLIKDNVFNKQVVDFITNAPDEIKQVMAAYENKQDYRSVGKKIFANGIDFSLPVEKIDDFTLVSNYNTDITMEDFEDMDEKPRNALLSSSKRAFEADKNAYTILTQSKERERREYTQRVVDSVERSVENMKKEFPNLTDTQVEDIRIKLYQNPLAHITDSQTGAYTDDAASKIAWSLYGKVTLNDYMNQMHSEVSKKLEIAARERASQDAEERAKRLGDKPTKLTDGEQDNARMAFKKRLGNIYGDQSINMFKNKERQ